MDGSDLANLKRLDSLDDGSETAGPLTVTDVRFHLVKSGEQSVESPMCCEVPVLPIR